MILVTMAVEGVVCVTVSATVILCRVTFSRDQPFVLAAAQVETLTLNPQPSTLNPKP
jgi:hypothetical protein